MDWYTLGFCCLISLPVVFLWWILEQVSFRRLLNKVAADVEAGNVPEALLEDPDKGIISLSEDGFTVRGQEVAWDDVEEIRAYKADLFSYDLICWSFCCSGNDCPIEANEEMVGFTKLQEAVDARYSVSQDWWDKVAFPAFTENMTVIWPRKGAPNKPMHQTPDGAAELKR